MVFSSNGRIYYASESVTSLLGYLPSELSNSTIYEITYQEDQSLLYNVLLNPINTYDSQSTNAENQVSFTCHIKRGNLDFQEEATYECVHFIGYFRSDADIESLIPSSHYGNNISNDTKLIFVGTGRLHTPQLIQDMSLVDGTRSEFTSRHSLEWKFLFLDHRAPPIIGYLPFEVLGTSGYDYYHVDDLDKVVTCHESLMQKGEGTSCHYRFLTKGQQWIWLQTRFYIDYNQWNSKPEFIVCTHNVVSYTEVMKQLKKIKEQPQNNSDQDSISLPVELTPPITRPTNWSLKSWKTSRSAPNSTRNIYQESGCSDTTSITVRSQNLLQSASTIHSSKLKVPTANSSKSMSQPEAPPRHRRQPEIEQIGLNYIEPPGFPSESILSIVPTTFLTPAAVAAPIIIPSTMLTTQPSIVLTTTQNQMQDELQRKHEELQQLIVHQQEELRRVSEQLLIARYGLMSPLVNVTSPYGNQGHDGPCDANSNDETTRATENMPEMGILSVPMALSAPIIPMEAFPHSATVVPVVSSIVTPTPGAQVNSTVQFMSQQPSQQPLQRHETQMQHIQPQAQAIHQEGAMIPFQICQQPEMMYSNVEASVNGQQRSTRNQ